MKHPVKPLEVVTQHHLSSPSLLSLPSLPSLGPSHPYASALAAGGLDLGPQITITFQLCFVSDGVPTPPVG